MAQIIPVNYHLVIEPNLEDFVFSGNADIRLEASEPAVQVELNALQLDIRRCLLVNADRRTPCGYETDTDRETLRITLPEKTRGTHPAGHRLPGDHQ